MNNLYMASFYKNKIKFVLNILFFPIIFIDLSLTIILKLKKKIIIFNAFISIYHKLIQKNEFSKYKNIYKKFTSKSYRK